MLLKQKSKYTGLRVLMGIESREPAEMGLFTNIHRAGDTLTSGRHVTTPPLRTWFHSIDQTRNSHHLQPRSSRSTPSYGLIPMNRISPSSTRKAQTTAFTSTLARSKASSPHLSFFFGPPALMNS